MLEDKRGLSLSRNVPFFSLSIYMIICVSPPCSTFWCAFWGYREKEEVGGVLEALIESKCRERERNVRVGEKELSGELGEEDETNNVVNAKIEGGCFRFIGFWC